jgi:hypothetical protein
MAVTAAMASVTESTLNQSFTQLTFNQSPAFTNAMSMVTCIHAAAARRLILQP